jgi:hypothetical protein
MKISNRDSTEAGVSRTNLEDLTVIQEFLTKFYLHEIKLLAHLNSIYSMYYIQRIERITSQLRLTFGSEHDVNHVRGFLDFFSDPNRRPQVWHHINLDQHLLTDAACHYIEPFIAICPVCNQHLNIKHCNQTRVYICHQRGKVFSGNTTNTDILNNYFYGCCRHCLFVDMQTYGE